MTAFSWKYFWMQPLHLALCCGPVRLLNLSMFGGPMTVLLALSKEFSFSDVELFIECHRRDFYLFLFLGCSARSLLSQPC